MHNAMKTLIQRADGYVSVPGYDYSTRKAVIAHEDGETLVMRLPARTAVFGAPGTAPTYMEPELVVFEKAGQWRYFSDGERRTRQIMVREITTIKLSKGWASRNVPFPTLGAPLTEVT